MLKHFIFPALLGLTSTLAAQTLTSFEAVHDPAQVGGYSIVTGDFNGDGLQDFVTGGSSTSLAIRLGHGDGTFQAPVGFGLAGQTLQQLIAVDLNGDGRLDLVTVTIQGAVTPYFGNGDGTFTAGTPITYSNKVAPNAVAAGDFNGDGLPDLAIGLSNGNTQIYSNVGGKNFALASTVPAITHPDAVWSIAAGDIDGNGTVDLVIGSGLQASALWGDGKGGFTPSILMAYPASSGAYVSLGDVNQDGFPDVMVQTNCSPSQPAGHASSECTNIDVFYGGQGSQKWFYRSALSNLPIGVYVAPVLAVDINGDGIADLAVSARDTNGSQEGMFFYLGNPDGSFNSIPERYVVTSDGVGEFALADFNRDGMMDVVQTLDSANNDEIYLNATTRGACKTSMINPTVVFCAPVDNTYSLSPVHVQATAYDKTTVTALQLYVDGILDYDQPVTNYDFTKTVSAGQHWFVAKTFDLNGVSFHSNRKVNVYTGTPGAVCPTVANAAAICVPASSGSSTHIIGNGDTSYVPTAAQLYIDGALVVNTQSGSSAIDTTQTLATGSHLLVFKLYDADGNVSTASNSVTVQ